jgi:hypothetical protein
MIGVAAYGMLSREDRDSRQPIDQDKAEMVE